MLSFCGNSQRTTSYWTATSTCEDLQRYFRPHHRRQSKSGSLWEGGGRSESPTDRCLHGQDMQDKWKECKVAEATFPKPVVLIRVNMDEKSFAPEVAPETRFNVLVACIQGVLLNFEHAAPTCGVSKISLFYQCACSRWCLYRHVEQWKDVADFKISQGNAVFAMDGIKDQPPVTPDACLMASIKQAEHNTICHHANHQQAQDRLTIETLSKELQDRCARPAEGWRTSRRVDRVASDNRPSKQSRADAGSSSEEGDTRRTKTMRDEQAHSI